MERKPPEMDREDVYMNIVNKYTPHLLSMQCTVSESSGIFFYPYWRGDVDFVNSRWQEAVLTLAWLWKKKGMPFRDRAAAGIDAWCRIQNSDGSFPEYCKGDRSFSATAFSTLAVMESSAMLGMKSQWLEHAAKAGRWLCRNDEKILINQEAAASVTLAGLYKATGDGRYLKGAESKLDVVLRNQAEDGYYEEKRGCDIGYSSLTLEMLGRYNLMRETEEITESAAKFIRFFNSAINVKNTRATDWVVLDGFETLAGQIPEAKISIRKIFGRCEYDFIHLPDERHLCTDLYRFCWAYENASWGMKVKRPALPLPVKASIGSMKSVKLKMLRRMGIHRFRGLKYVRCSM